MTTSELDTLRQSVGVKQALQAMTEDGDTGLQVSNPDQDGTKVRLTSMIDGLERPPIPIIKAEMNLKKVLADGNPAFWIPGLAYDPPEPFAGSTFCMLHPDFDESDGPAGIDRAFVDAAGLKNFNCNRGDPSKNNKADFQSVFDRDQHMKHKHKSQWELIEAAINKDEERDEKTQRQLDREILMQLAGMKAGAEQKGYSEVCETCGDAFTSTKGLSTHQRMSRDEAHVEARA